MDRIIGEFVGNRTGPLIILIGGLHGNEYTGIKAIQAVFQKINDEDIPVNGIIVGVRGNLMAIKDKMRYVDYDLNRCWTEQNLTRISRKNGHILFSEDRDVMDLNRIFNTYGIHEPKSKICVDLHTTSSDNGNFIVVPESCSEHPVIRALRLPLILNLEKHIKGTLLNYLTGKGYLSFAFEGGLIGSEAALRLHIAGIWEILLTTGAVPSGALNGVYQLATLLQTFASELPHKLKVRHHYWITEEDGFRMKPGYMNFQKVKAGEIIAENKNGPVAAPRDGLIFMPLYQRSGNDGFFIVEEIDTFI